MSKDLVILPPPTVPMLTDQPIIVDELVMDDGTFGNFALGHIRISTTNRKRFSISSLNELAASIKAIGIAQPILIRRVTPTADAPQQFEIVAGERRYRAAIMAGLTHVPAMCRRLSDLDAAKIQIFENLHRDDPHALEEAIGYEQLMLQHGYSADQLVGEIKKSRSYVYGRLKLCALCNDVRELFLDFPKEFSASLALLIARIPVPALQVKATKEILFPRGGDTPQALSYRQAADVLQERFMLDLTKATFPIKDAKLLAAAGACAQCHKRAGNQPEVFKDVNADTCTDPDC